MKAACTNYPICQNVVELPKDVDIEWVNPEGLVPNKLPTKVEKALKKNPKSADA
jgi:hypothetical protein